MLCHAPDQKNDHKLADQQQFNLERNKYAIINSVPGFQTKPNLH